MPTLPIIQDREQIQVSTGRQRVQADAGAFGAQEARGLAQVSQGLQAVAQVAEDKQDEFDEAEALELDNELSRRMMQRLYNTEDGYLSTQRGRNAVDARGQAEADIDEMAAEIASRASNPRVAAAVSRVARNRVTSGLGLIATHAADENRSYLNAQIEEAINSDIDNAVAAYGDWDMVQSHINTASGRLARAAELNGWAPKMLASRVRRLQSDITARAIVQLAGTDPAQAEELYQQARPHLSAQDAASLRTTMRAARREAEDNMVDEAWVHVSNGQRIPPELWAQLPGRSRIDIQDYIRNRAEGGAAGDRALFNDYMNMMLYRPQEFARAQLGLDRGRLGEVFYGSLQAEQARIRLGGARTGANDDTLRSAGRMSALQLRILGFPLTSEGQPSASAEPEEIRRLADFQADLIGIMDRFVEENGRQPNAQEQMVAIQNLIATRSHDPSPGLWNDADTWHVFETYTPYGLIPRDDRERIEGRLRAAGDAVTRSNVERYYELEQVARRRGEAVR